MISHLIALSVGACFGVVIAGMLHASKRADASADQQASQAKREDAIATNAFRDGKASALIANHRTGYLAGARDYAKQYRRNKTARESADRVLEREA